MAHLLWLTPFPPAAGRSAGAGRMLELIRRLAHRHRVDVLSFVDDEGEAETERALREAGAAGVRLVRRRPDRRPDWLGLRPAAVAEYRDPAMAGALADTLARERPDVLQVEYTPMAMYAPGRGAIRMVWTIHELGTARLRRERARRRGPVRALLAYRGLQMLHFELSHAARFDRVVVIAADEADELRRRGAGVPLDVSPMGADTRALAPVPGVVEEPGLVVFVGFFGHEPNVDAARWLATDVLPRVRAVVPGAHAALVGRDPTPAVEALAAPGAVEVTGFVADLRPWLARAQAVVVPVREGGGVRGKVVEAWAAGRPVVSTRLGCAGLDARDGENVLLAEDADGLARQIARCLRDATLRRALGARGRETAVARYDWDGIAAAHDAMYAELLDRRGRAA